MNYSINGISLGSVHAIIAFGYTVVYGITKMLNFTHGDIVMIGSYVVFVTVSTMGLPPMTRVLLAVAVCALLGMTAGRTACGPLRGVSPLVVLVMAIGVSYLLRNVTLLVFGADTKSFTSTMTLPVTKLAGGEVTITEGTVVTTPSCVIIMIGLTAFINKSKAGQAMLAVSEDGGTATLMGINVNGTIALTFVISPAPVAITGVLLHSAYPSLTPYTSSMPGIKAFVTAVFGGIGSISGTFIGGILLGVVRTLSKACISSQMLDAIMFSVLTIMFLVKSTGILGEKINEKVQVLV